MRPPLRWWIGWVALPALLAVVVSANIDRTAPPVLGPERLSAVLVLDGQAYFGHLEDNALADSVILRDVYYLQDARSSSAGVPVALVRRGSEIHDPANGMRIRRDRLLAIERVGPGSPVITAIATDRALNGTAR